MLSRLFLVSLFFICAGYSSAQEYNYQHYDLKNGLSGLTVYSIAQDKDGFLWFGTETGLSRFDGSNFKNFTTADGLPDNEILKLYVDSKNRVWILPFSHSISYYKDGKIYSQKNDSLLSKIELSSEPVDILEDKSGNIVIIENTAIHIIAKKGEVTSYNNFGKKQFLTIGIGINENGNAIVTGLPVAYTGGWGFFEIKESVLGSFKFVDTNYMGFVDRLSVIARYPLRIFRRNNVLYLIFKNKNENYESHIPLPEHFSGLSYLCDTLFTLNSNNSVSLYNVNQKKITDRFSLGKTVNCTFKDNEENYWFATAGYGVYRLTSNAFKNYSLISQNNPLPVYSLFKNNDSLLVGSNQSLLWTIDLNKNALFSKKMAEDWGGARISGIVKKGNKLIIGSSQGVYCYNNYKQKSILQWSDNIKNIYNYDDTFLISTNRYVVRMDLNKSSIIDTIWRQRATCAYKFDNFYYIGTLGGLYKVNEKKQTTFLGKNEPLLASRISGIGQSGDTLWIATYGNGIVAYSKNKICKHITEKDGLTSNMCRVVDLYKGGLWIGTDKGLNRIILSDISGKISKFTSKDGLNCDIINCLLVEKDTVYIGTPYGLVLFNPSNVNNNSIAALHINYIRSKKNTWDGDTIELKAGDNRFAINFSCISFKSQGNITYHYKLSGLDRTWQTTKENIIDYASLPAGDYTFQLYAVNAFDKKSNSVVIKFTIDKFFYQKTWFIILLSVLGLLLAWYLVRKRIAKIKKEEKQKLVTQKRLSELEQMAFKSQMNPHFIFNCLNSIQQYIFDRNVIDANKFVTDFSSLIRQTLYISSKKIISLQEEVKYLDTYLKLEHARFDENFDYEIFVAPELTSEDIYLPPLLLQPYIENSIRHGIRNLKNKRGKLLVKFNVQNDYLFCVAEDNGIGRKAAGQMKDKNAIEYQSKGMSLIRQRIDALNSETTKKIKITIEDVFPGEQDTGTRIIIQIPLDTDRM